ncbi:hypothetical protein BG015_008899 [Linnemannia schmuckeri]|uniref:Uncharacterized protein n=1 Tax=Linnemannia schmuckeri TaxID=64567 RepID=A0A9P5RW90_9FUNG|nr:hypothetical protein BG015_008899 [Linnemannia schmuckeri]
MRPFLVCLLAAVLPATCLARQESFCEDKVSYRGRLFGRPAYHDLQEQVPGWVFFNQNRIQGRVHGNTFWNIKGELKENFPMDDFMFDPVTYTLNHPADFEGPFSGKIGRGEITLKWERSGATITGRSPIGDFEVEGKTYVDWSP